MRSYKEFQIHRYPVMSLLLDLLKLIFFFQTVEMKLNLHHKAAAIKASIGQWC